MKINVKRSCKRGCTLLFLLLVVPNAFAQDRHARLTLFGGGSFVQGNRTFVVDFDPLRSEFVAGGKFGLRGTVDLTDNWAVEAAYSFGRNNLRITELDEVPPEERGFGLRIHQFTGNLLYFLNTPEERFRPFVTAGLGVTNYNPTGRAKVIAATMDFIDESALLRSSNKFAFNLGIGLEAIVTERLGVRLDFRDHITKIPRFGVPAAPPGSGVDFFPVGGSIHSFETSVGIVIYFQH